MSVSGGAQAVREAVEEYCTILKRRQLEGSLPCAKKTADVLRLLITKKGHADAAALIDDVRSTGYLLQGAKPVELAIGNMVRRVLHMIREEAKKEQAEGTDDEKPSTSAGAPVQLSKKQMGLLSQAMKMARGPSLSNLLEGIEEPEKLLAPLMEQMAAAAAGNTQQDADLESNVSTKRPKQKNTTWKGKHEVIEVLNELISELNEIQTEIVNQGGEHIHANEVILTLGMSDTTFLFLKEAAKKRFFQVVVAEGAPKMDGHQMARKLADANIQTTLIPDSAVFAMMARANKVLVGAHAVLANGGVVAPVGMHMVALAAKRHSIPFVVLVGLHKLSPLFPHDTDLAYNDFKSPAEVADYAETTSHAFMQQERLLYSVRGASFGIHGPEGSGQGSISGMSSYTDGAGAPSSSSGPGGPQSGAGASGSPLSSSPNAAGFLNGASGAGGFAGDTCIGGNVHIPNPAFDYVPPHLISLFITDTGGHTPSYVYRLITEYYSREDYLLSKAVW